MKLQDLDLAAVEETKVESFICMLADIKLLDAGVVHCVDKDYKLDITSIEDLCKLLDVPVRFQKRVASISAYLWVEIAAKLQVAHNHDVRVYFKGDTIKSIVHVDSPDVSNGQMLDALLNNPVIQNLDVTRYSIDDDGILVTFTDPARDFSTGSWSDLGNDIFRVGISFQGNQLGHNRPRLTEGVERLICTNMTYMMMRRHSYALNVKRRSLDVLLEERFGTWSQNNTIINLVNDRVNLLKNTSASYLEVETVFYSLASLIDDSECALVPDLYDRIPVHSIAMAYGGEHPLKRSNKFKATAKTPINLYDLYNHLTDVGSNNKKLSTEDSLSLGILGGKFLMKTPDLVDVAPQTVIF